MRLLISFASLTVLLLSGCSWPGEMVRKIEPYRIDIRQGNYVDQSMVSQLKKGMSREQVRFVLGTPLIEDPFHADRWDYVYWFRPGGGKVEERHFSVFFVDGKLDHLAGDVKAGDGKAAEADAAPSRRVIDFGAKKGDKKEE